MTHRITLSLCLALLLGSAAMEVGAAETGGDPLPTIPCARGGF